MSENKVHIIYNVKRILFLTFFETGKDERHMHLCKIVQILARIGEEAKKKETKPQKKGVEAKTLTNKIETQVHRSC
jgi:hypothetical protein